MKRVKLFKQMIKAVKKVEECDVASNLEGDQPACFIATARKLGFKVPRETAYINSFCEYFAVSKNQAFAMLYLLTTKGTEPPFYSSNASHITTGETIVSGEDYYNAGIELLAAHGEL